jgi:7,8-dihydro-6-hydroxymethylpterin-pyrophosphokinase
LPYGEEKILVVAQTTLEPAKYIEKCKKIEAEAK